MRREELAKQAVVGAFFAGAIGIMMISGCGNITKVEMTDEVYTKEMTRSSEEKAIEATGTSAEDTVEALQSSADPSSQTEEKVTYLAESVVKSNMGRRAAASDGSFADLPLLSKAEARPEETMEIIPYDTELTGSAAGYYFIPMDGGIYRYNSSIYSVQSMHDQGISLETNELIYTFHETGISENYIWEVYSLKAYPEKDLLFADCLGNYSIILSYSPERSMDENEMEDAKENGFVIMENGSVISGKEIWQEFCEKVAQGQPAVVKLGYYYTLDERNMTKEAREAIKGDYPVLFLKQLYYDGNVFTVSPVHKLGEEYVIYEISQEDSPERTYSYLMHFADKSDKTSAKFTAYDKYVLTNDDQVTWEQLEYSMFSSVYGDYIPHDEVFCEYTWKK